MNTDAKVLNKIFQAESNHTSKRSYNMTKLVSFQGCKDGSTYINP
jgi:hypothetical protein